MVSKFAYLGHIAVLIRLIESLMFNFYAQLIRIYGIDNDSPKLSDSQHIIEMISKTAICLLTRPIDFSIDINAY